MNTSLKLMLAGAALVVGLGVAQVQASDLDVVRDMAGTPVRTTNGDCLRFNQDAGADTCPGAVQPIVRETKSVFFAFGSSKLSPEAKKTLDAVAADMKAKNVVGLRVAGFADTVGDAAKNEKLSKKRADEVRKYLVTKGIVNAQVVETRWFGESAAATKCPKEMPRAKRIKCMQPDRRVDIEMDIVPAAPKAE